MPAFWISFSRLASASACTAWLSVLILGIKHTSGSFSLTYILNQETTFVLIMGCHGEGLMEVVMISFWSLHEMPLLFPKSLTVEYWGCHKTQILEMRCENWYTTIHTLMRTSELSSLWLDATKTFHPLCILTDDYPVNCCWVLALKPLLITKVFWNNSNNR